MIPVDSIFSPVRQVAYRVENTQVGQMTNFDRLVLDIETNGAIEPAEAVSSAGKTLGELMGLFADIGEGQGLELGDVEPEISSSPGPRSTDRGARPVRASPQLPSPCPDQDRW